MATYHFVTRWLFQAPIEGLWGRLGKVAAWTDWLPQGVWRGAVRSAAADAGVGTVVDWQVRGFLPYTLRFSTEVTVFEPPTLMAVRSSGDLTGEGRVVLEPRDPGTAVTVYWDVATTHPLFNVVSCLPLIRTVMEKNHRYVMTRVYPALKPAIEGDQGTARFAPPGSSLL